MPVRVIAIQSGLRPLVLSAVLWLAMAIIGSSTIRADIYFWQDEHGVIHFSNQDAPPSATLYMREPEPVVTPTASVAPAETGAQTQTQARLEQTQRKLEQALERVEELTEKIRDSQQEAAVASALAQQAAQISVATAVQGNSNPEVVVRDRVVYVTAPTHGRLGRHKGHHFKNRHFDHRKRIKPHGPGHFKRHSILHRHGPSRHIGPVRINGLHKMHWHQRPSAPVPFRHRIPKAYGIR